MMCCKCDGADAIHEVLLAGIEVGKDAEKLQIKLVVFPVYSLSIIVFDSQVGIEWLNSVIQVIHDKIVEKGGTLQR